jgi:hypothetical protein
MNLHLAPSEETSMRHTECIAPNVLIHDPRRSAMMDLAMGPAPTRQAHDIRNFLYLASSFAQLMLEGLSGPVSAQQKELLGHIVDCMGRAQKLLVPAGGASRAA